MAGEGSADNLRPTPRHSPILGRNPLAALWMACSPTPETLRHPPLCNDNRPLFGPACGGPQNLAGEVESLSHINRWIAAPGRSAALPSVMVGVVTPAAFTISARGAVVVFAREKLDRATARRGPRYSVAFFVTFFCTGGAGSVTAGAAADFVASCASAGAIAVAAGTAKAAVPAGYSVEPVPDWLAAISSSWWIGSGGC